MAAIWQILCAQRCLLAFHNVILFKLVRVIFYLVAILQEIQVIRFQIVPFVFILGEKARHL